MNAKALKRARKAARSTPVEYTDDPTDTTKVFRCPCGTVVPRPSFSVAKGVYITSRHTRPVIIWAPLRSKSGVLHVKPITTHEVCTAFEPPAEPPPPPAKEPEYEVGEFISIPPPGVAL